jgi:acetyl-CoA synthetase
VSTTAFLEARSLLLARRERYEEAVREFRWPVLDQFNWALDWFDAYARENVRPALRLVRDGGPEATLSFAELSARSSQVANRLRALGARRGDGVLVMLPNVVPLWETLLGAMKLGLVVVPATPQLGRADRFARGAIRHVVTDEEGAGKLETLAPDCTRVALGPAPPGWHDFGETSAEPASFEPDGPTRATDPFLLYFTSGTTALPKLVLHTHQSYPGGAAPSRRGTRAPRCSSTSTTGSSRHASSTCSSATASTPSAPRRWSGGCWSARGSRAGRYGCARP